MNTLIQTDGLTDEELTEAFEYLDELRSSGDTNMFGARAYIVHDLDWPKHEAGIALKAWMHTFDKVSTVQMRVSKAQEKVA